MIAQRMKNLNPYKPGEQPKDRDYIKLNANENPFPPPREVIDAVKKMADDASMNMALYPDPESVLLKEAIANHLNTTGGVLAQSRPLDKKLTAENIFVGNGSDEVLSFVFYAFFDELQPLIVPMHTYSFYPVYASYYGICLDKVPLCKDFSLDVATMLDKMGSTETPLASGMIFANPNAPTGLALSLQQIEEILQKYPKNRVLVVDEAYMDFGKESALPLLEKYENLLIVRTFSKSLSFAGMRLGYAVGNPQLIQALTVAKNSFNHFPVDAVTQTAGIAACKALDYYQKNTREIVQVRDDFIAFLREKGWIVDDSDTNFVLAKKEGMTGETIYQKIKEKGILVRYFAIPLIDEYVRISIGSRGQMEKLQEVIALF